jgi:hypothetical protein
MDSGFLATTSETGLAKKNRKEFDIPAVVFLFFIILFYVLQIGTRTVSTFRS